MDGEASIHEDVETTAVEIDEMEVRGAATIAAAVADALETQATESEATTVADLRAELRAAARRLYDTRPTAVSLANALRQVLANIEEPADLETLRERVQSQARSFRNDLESAQEQLGGYGADRLEDGDTVMTHCHSTAVLASLETAVDRGLDLEAIVKETRPRQQGHLTARHLDDLDVPVTLIVDGAARHYIDQVDHVMVGADSITATGEVVNKIGTADLATVATECGVPVACHASTIKLHPETTSGAEVPIEERDPAEVLSDPAAEGLEGITVENPAFDVTPPRLIDTIVTEHGPVEPASIGPLLEEQYGQSPDRPWE